MPEDITTYHVKAFHVSFQRHRKGFLTGISVIDNFGRLFVEYAEDAAINAILKLANDEERNDPYSGKLPSDASIIKASLRETGSPFIED